MADAHVVLFDKSDFSTFFFNVHTDKRALALGSVGDKTFSKGTEKKAFRQTENIRMQTLFRKHFVSGR